MIIEHIVEIPADYRLHLELPRSVPVGVKARIEISIPSPNNRPDTEAQVKSFRGILKGRGITLEQFRDMQSEDKAIEDKNELYL